MTTHTHTRTVVTWSTPGGATIDICTDCRDRLEAAAEWPRSPSTGEEYCQVQRGAHHGYCDLDR